MRFTNLLLGGAVGVAIYYWYRSAQQALFEGDGRHRFDKATEPKHTVQAETSHLRVTELVNDVVHEKDVPDTAVKAAFEDALGHAKG